VLAWPPRHALPASAQWHGVPDRIRGQRDWEKAGAWACLSPPYTTRLRKFRQNLCNDLIQADVSSDLCPGGRPIPNAANDIERLYVSNKSGEHDSYQRLRHRVLGLWFAASGAVQRFPSMNILGEAAPAGATGEAMQSHGRDHR
jgi:hypothetical protein